MNALIQSIYDTPEDWRCDKYHFRYKDGRSFWIANGFLFLRSEGFGSLNLWQRIKAYVAYRWWIANAPLEVATR